MSAATAPVDSGRVALAVLLGSAARRNAWILGLLGFLALLLVFTKLIQPNYGVTGVQGLAISVLPLALAAVAQAIVVISGGIDLSIGSMMALINVVSAALMKGQSEEFGVAVVVGVAPPGPRARRGQRRPGRRHPRAGHRGHAGDVVRVGRLRAAGAADSPGGGSAQWLKDLVTGSLGNEWIPKAAVVLVIVVAVIWIPVRRSRLGLSIYAIGSNRLAAFRSGVSVGRTRILAYALMGLFAALAGLSLTASTGIGTPVPGPYTLMSVAAVVLGGVSLAGGRGGVFGPIVAVMILQIIRTDMTFLDVDTNLATVLQGLILIGVVMIGSLVQIRRARA